MENELYDVIVIGVGSMGSSACYYLSKAGARVLGLEQYSAPHEKGSHAGQSRIIRKAYFEHPDYVPLLERTYTNWRVLESEIDEKLFHDTGLLYSGPEGDELLVNVKKSAGIYEIELQNVNEIESRFPKFSVPDNFETLFEPDAGFVLPERTISVLIEKARELGAEIMENTKVLSYELFDQGVRVYTHSGHFNAKKLIFTTGAYTQAIQPTISSRLSVTQQLISWVEPQSSFGYYLGDFPCWVVSNGKDPGVYYGFPMLKEGIKGLKVAHHDRGIEIKPEDMASFDDIPERKKLKGFMDQFLPGTFKSFNKLKSCLYTYSENGDFILDFLPDTNQRVILAAGFSGHGFKFVPVVGEILKDMTLYGKTDLPVGFLKLDRKK